MDCIVLAAGGALVDALSFAIWAALRDTLLPAVSVADNIEDASAADIEVDDDPYAGLRLDVARLPVVLGVCQVRALQACQLLLTALQRTAAVQIGRRVMLGCSVVEEAAASGRLLTAINASGQVCGVQKSGHAAMSLGGVQHMISAAQKQGAAVLAALTAHARKQRSSEV